MSTALQLHTETMAEWQILRQQAEVLVKTKFLPKSIETPEQAMAIMLTGRELGIGPMAALNTINVIAGKPTISPQLMLALINRTGELEDFLVSDDGQCCAVGMKRRGRQVHSETFSMKDAALMKTTEYIGGEKKTISLSEKYNWKQQPAVMRKWRAIAACARVVFPDVILGLYTPDEMGAHTDGETGEVIEVIAHASETAEDLQVHLMEQALDAEPEPVSTVNAQPKADKAQWPKAPGIAGQIFAKCQALGWTTANLADEIEKRFKMAIPEEAVISGLADALTTPELKTLDQSLAGEFNNRNRTR